MARSASPSATGSGGEHVSAPVARAALLSREYMIYTNTSPSLRGPSPFRDLVLCAVTARVLCAASVFCLSLCPLVHSLCLWGGLRVSSLSPRRSRGVALRGRRSKGRGGARRSTALELGKKGP